MKYQVWLLETAGKYGQIESNLVILSTVYSAVEMENTSHRVCSLQKLRLCKASYCFYLLYPLCYRYWFKTILSRGLHTWHSYIRSNRDNSQQERKRPV